MPRVEASALVAAAPARVFAIARDIERFPEFMSDVKSVRITEKSDTAQVSEWVALISKFRIEVKWTEEDIWDEETLTCRWRQTKGDFQQYDGVWSFAPDPAGTRMQLTIDYVYEVPLLGPILKALVAKLMQENVDTMLAALKAEAEKGA